MKTSRPKPDYHLRVPIEDLPAQQEGLAEQCRYGPLVLTHCDKDIVAVVSLEFLDRALSILHGNREVLITADFKEADADLLRRPTLGEMERNVWDDEATKRR